MTYASEVLADSPVRAYHLDETVGTAIADYSTNAVPGDTAGTPTFGVAGVVGTGIQNNGTNSYISTVTTSLGFTTAWSLEFWYKYGSTSGAVLWRDATGAGGWLMLLANSNADLTVRGNGTDRTIAGAGTTLTNGRWHHVVMTSSGTSIVTYIDGAAVDTWARTTNASTVAHPLRFGRNGTTSAFYTGSYDEIAIYTSVLSGARVAAHYNARGGSIPTAVVGDGASATVARLTWLGPATGSPPTGYEVRIDGGTPVDVGSALTYDFTGLTAATEYDLEVRAYATGWSSSWVLATVTTDGLSASDYAVLTIPSGTVASTLTGFVVRVDLADLPDSVWDVSDGEDLRVRQGGLSLPLDVVAVDSAARTGELFFRVPSLDTGTDNIFTVEAVTGATVPTVTSPIGRNAVWADYDAVVMFAEFENRTGGTDPILVGVSSGYALSTEFSSTAFQQGAAWDGTYWYATGGSNNLRVQKYNAAGVSQAVVTDLAAATGLPFDHLGGCCVKDGELYVVPGDYVIVLNLADLSYNRHYDLTAFPVGPSDICWNSDDSIFVGCDFANSTTLHVYDETFSSHSTLTLPSPGVGAAQGIEWAAGTYYLMRGPFSSGSSLYAVNDDMSGARTELWRGANHMQGLCVKNQASSTPDIWLGTSSGYLGKLTYTAGTADPGWLALTGAGHVVVQNLPKRTVWTMGATAKLETGSPITGPVLSYSDHSGTDANRETLSIDASNDKWDIWDSSNGHAYGTTFVSGDYGIAKRVNAVFNGTTSRRMYLQGVQDAEDLVTTQRPAGGSDGTMALFIGTPDTDAGSRWVGSLNYVYLRNGVLSADWLAAEQDSWNDAGFYAITEEHTVGPPNPPTSLSVVEGSTNLALSWVAPSTGDAPDGYEVRIDGGSVTDVGNVLTYDFTGLAEDTTYTLEVRAYNGVGSSSWASLAADTLAPSAPTAIPSRTFVIPSGLRVLLIDTEDRTYVIANEDRTLRIYP